MNSGERTERTAKTIAKVGEIMTEFPKPDTAQGCLVRCFQFDKRDESQMNLFDQKGENVNGSV